MVMSSSRLALLVLSVVAVLPVASAQSIERLSVSSGCVVGNGASSRPAVSRDGRFIAFYSEANNLVQGDTNGVRDIFLRDRQQGTTIRISVASNGQQANGPSSRPAMSASGRFIVYTSDASNLVTGDTNGMTDIFLYDRVTAQTSRVSVTSGGVQANGPSSHPTISSNGQMIAFDSFATNLVGSDNNAVEDVFVHNRSNGTTVIASLRSTSTIQGNADSNRPSLSADGNLIAFKSEANNLIAGDTNVFSDIFVRNMTTQVVTRVSVDDIGTEADEDSTQPWITGDGRYVVFTSFAGNLVPGDFNDFEDIFVHDRQTGDIERVSVGPNGLQSDNNSDFGSISDDGRYVVFQSVATNLVGDDLNGVEDVFLHDRQTSTTTLVSRAFASGQPGNAESARGVIADDGSWIAFRSEASNFVSGDTPLSKDVFLAERADFAEQCQGIDGLEVLTVNGLTGQANGRRVVVSAGGTLNLDIVRPGGRGNGKFMAHMNDGTPDDSTRSPIPFQLGAMCFDPLIAPAGNGDPVANWNNIGRVNKVGSSQYFGVPMANPPIAPTRFLELPSGDLMHFTGCSRWTIQAVIRNPSSSSSTGYSVTNAVIIEVVP